MYLRVSDELLRLTKITLKVSLQLMYPLVLVFSFSIFSLFYCEWFRIVSLRYLCRALGSIYICIYKLLGYVHMRKDIVYMIECVWCVWA